MSDPVLIAYRTRPLTSLWNDPKTGALWRGGRVLNVDGDVAVLEVLAEAGAPLVYRGPVSAVPSAEANAPIVCRLKAPWPYRLLEVRGSYFGNHDDFWRARQGDASGVYAVVPPAIRHEIDVLWRQEQYA